MKYSNFSIFLIAIIIGAIVGLSSVFAEEKAQWSTSRYSSDIQFIVVTEYRAERWYIGPCSGDNTPSYERTKLYQVYNKGPGIKEVRLVSKYKADKIYCIKD